MVFPEGKQILLVDDPTQTSEMLSILKSLGVRVMVAQSAADAMSLAVKEEFDMALVRVGLAGGGPDDLLTRLIASRRITSILVMAHEGIARHAIQTLGRGAADYLLTPPDRAEVRARVGRILRWQDQDDRVTHLQKDLSRKYLLGNLVCLSPGMGRVRNEILQVASARSTVLIKGESGVGKELVAKAIHYNSPRRGAPFVAINCSAIPVTLIESELFGHERGAFTGAVERRKGKFELADGGTILLDEIGDMDLQTQAKLLRVLEEREFMRVGGGREVKVDVRVLAATNSDLEAMIARGRFRDDLYFRLNVITIHVPPLRERLEDIPDLAPLFLEQICRDNGLPRKTLTRQAIQGLQRYPWPGNVRELKNVLESTAITRSVNRVRLGDLPPAVRDGGLAGALGSGPRFGLTLEQAERNLIRSTLIRCSGNRTHTARALRIGVRTLQRKVKAYGIQVPFRRARRNTGRPKPSDAPRPGTAASGGT
jgi:DNA-binding NtrC family response regulator